jgi:TRAP-type C4-dicarboxylate transport system permease small subunit
MVPSPFPSTADGGRAGERKCAHMIEIIEKVLRKAVAFTVALQGLALTLLIGTEVFFRYIVGRALSWPEEVAGIFFVWFTFLGVVLLTQSGEHIEFNFLAQRLSSRASKVLSVFIQVMIGLYALFISLSGYTYAVMFQFENTPAAGINSLWLNLSLPISGLLIFFYSQLNILKILKSPAKGGR